MEHDHVKVIVTDGARSGAERVPARQISDTEWQLLRSPLFAMGVAAGDIIRVTNHETGEFKIIARSGNVCVQFYLGESDADDAEATMKVSREIAIQIEPLGGSLDAHVPGLIAFTLPVDVGLPAIERVASSTAERHPGAEWQYSNVYDPATGNPLGWWKKE